MTETMSGGGSLMDMGLSEKKRSAFKKLCQLEVLPEFLTGPKKKSEGKCWVISGGSLKV